MAFGPASRLGVALFEDTDPFVPYNQLSQEYQRIHKQGGVIASITPVN